MTLVRTESLMPTVMRYFDDFFTRDWFDWTTNHFSATNTTVPAVNIIETPESYIVEMAAPGMDKKDFKIELKDNVLTISSERKNESELKEGERYLRREFSYQSFYRSFTLNEDVVDEEHIKATYENGMLRLLIPKKEEVRKKAPRLIAVK